MDNQVAYYNLIQQDYIVVFIPTTYPTNYPVGLMRYITPQFRQELMDKVQENDITD